MTLIELNDLVVEYETEEGDLQAVSGVNLDINSGETIGIVGESGCGKTTAAKSIMGLLDKNGKISEGEILFEGENLTELSESELRNRIRWKKISYIPQNAMAALDPVYKVGNQMVEVIRKHTDKTKSQARNRTSELFTKVGLEPSLMNDYPHELSGGQRQRVTIALSLALTPSLIIADEPTTGLDVVIQDEIIELLNDIQEEIGCAIIFVTHDMSVVAEISDKVVVMYGGRIMERGPIEAVFKNSAHPYTIGLQNAFPKMERSPSPTSLISIPGSPPDLLSPPEGCRFADRCPFGTEECHAINPPFVAASHEDHRIECHYPEKAEEFRQDGQNPETWQDREELDIVDTGEAIE